MAAVDLPPPPLQQPFLDGVHVSALWGSWLTAVAARLGGPSDKVEAAWQAAAAAAPAGTQIVAVGGLHVGGDLTGNVAVAFYRALTTVAALPTAGIGEGDWAYALDGRKAGEAAGAGTGVPVWFSNGAWCAVDSGAAVAA